jgi:hypothetical protein
MTRHAARPSALVDRPGTRPSLQARSLQFRAMPTRLLLALAFALLFAVAAPAATLAQSAGDNQYSDPFGSGGGGNSSSGGGGGNSSSGGGGGGGGGNTSSGGGASSGGGGGVATSSSGTGTGTTTGTTGTTGGAGVPQGPQLARTGADTALVAFAGAGLLLCGVGLRLRTRPSRQ